jgi:NAD(P)-dependent dehydrogenase (short-subunit alcohol dehydrogenase family)
MTTDAFIPMLKKSKAPRIIIMSSCLGSIGNTLNPEYPFYGLAERGRSYKMSKAATNMVGAVFAVQYKDDGIRVNVVNPGYRATNLNNHSEQAGKKEDGALEACKMIVLENSSETATYTELEGPIPW